MDINEIAESFDSLTPTEKVEFLNKLDARPLPDFNMTGLRYCPDCPPKHRWTVEPKCKSGHKSNWETENWEEESDR